MTSTHRIQSLAPVALFVYKRPDHTQRLLDSLVANLELGESPFVVYCDGPRTDGDAPLVSRTRAVVHAKVPKHTEVVERSANLGLANSIIAGVTELCEKYGRVIVFEDDLIVSPSVLKFLNTALQVYEKHERVMHIAAYMFPVARQLPPAFFYREATCWGWATWARAWQHFQSDPHVILQHVESRALISQFNVNDTMYFWEMLKQQSEGRIDSWAIRWYGSLFMRNGLSLHPGRPLARNEGFDGSGVHCGVTREFEVELATEVPDFPSDVSECDDAVQAMMEYRGRKRQRWTAAQLLKGFLRRVRRRARRML